MIISVIFNCYSELSHFAKVFSHFSLLSHFSPLEIMSAIFPLLNNFLPLEILSAISTAQPVCKMAECGARVVAQSRAHEREAA
jgi:hypothetical protein